MTDAGVTVCIPTFDEEETIGMVLDALQAQTTPPEEIIVVDGGSTDSTRSIAESYSVTVLVETDGGPAKARNVGLDACTTPVFGTIDADAVPSKDWLETITSILEEWDADAVGAKIIQEGLSPSARWRARRMDFISQEDTGPIERLPGNNVVFRTESLREIGGWDESYQFANEDIDLSQRLKESGYRLICTLRTTVYYYGVTGIPVVTHLWHWYSPGGVRFSSLVSTRSLRHCNKSGKYVVEDLSEGF